MADGEVPDEPGAGDLLPPGTPVGEYVLDVQLGEGGFARVYEAHHDVLGTRVAIKVLSRALALDTEAMQRFVREAQAASRIAHPGVVRVLGFGKLADGRAYQVMELVNGPTLESYIEGRGRLDIEAALDILAAIAAALDGAHAAGIVHRDLKPANVLLATVDGRLVPRLADFGIAKALEGDDSGHLTRTGTTLGTPMYMSPEQALGRPVGPSSDVYSFGVVAFELLTGRLPFEGESAFATMMLHVQGSPPAPSTIDAALARFDAAILQLLAKEPPDRPPTIAEAMAALRVAPAPGERAGPAPRRARRTGLIAVFATGVVVLGAIGLGAVVLGGRPEGVRDPSPTAVPSSPVPVPTISAPPAAPVMAEVPPAAPAGALAPDVTVPGNPVPPGTRTRSGSAAAPAERAPTRRSDRPRPARADAPRARTRARLTPIASRRHLSTRPRTP